MIFYLHDAGFRSVSVTPKNLPKMTGADLLSNMHRDFKESKPKNGVKPRRIFTTRVAQGFKILSIIQLDKNILEN